VLQAVILAENVVYALLRLAEKPAVNVLKPVANQTIELRLGGLTYLNYRFCIK